VAAPARAYAPSRPPHRCRHHAPPPAIALMTVPVPAPNKRPPIAHRADGVVAEVNNGSETGA
jgi:hypothetical protein